MTASAPGVGRRRGMCGLGGSGSGGRRDVRSDRGSATLPVLAVGLVLLSAGLAGATLGGAQVARHRAESAADFAALAGAARAVEGTEAACGRAAALAAANQARLRHCIREGLEVTVTVEVTPPVVVGHGRVATATARAGPVVVVG